MKIELTCRWVGGSSVNGIADPEHSYYEYTDQVGKVFGYRCSACGILGRTYMEVQGLCQRLQARENVKNQGYCADPKQSRYLTDVLEASDFSWPVTSAVPEKM